MKKPHFLIFLILLITSLNSHSQTFDIQGHRGCRGLLPENSIQGFIKAIDLGVTTLEMDVVISADGKVVVSHDPYMSSKICVNELGKSISKKEEKDINIFLMDYEDVLLFDCGNIGNPGFPEQEIVSVYKPLLSEVIEECENHVKQNDLIPVSYNIELKSKSSGDHIFHPDPMLFSKLVFLELEEKLPKERITIQSFDMRILQMWKLKYTGYSLALLVEGSKSPKKCLEELGFDPDIFSPYYKMLNSNLVDELHQKSIKVIPWTVNNKSDMQKMVKMGVDGLITDYPNRYFELYPPK